MLQSLLTGTNHVYNFLQQILFKGSGLSFNEMLAHHLMSCTLIIFAYSCNLWQVILTVLFCHDSGDFFMKLWKVTRDLKFLKTVAMDIIYVLGQFFFIYGRLIVPCLCYIPNLIISINKFFQESKLESDKYFAKPLVFIYISKNRYKFEV